VVIWGLPEPVCQCWAMDDVTEGSSPSGATLRHKLVFGRSVRTVTMMQSCASAAKLRGDGPILNRGSKAIVLYRVAATSVRHLQLAINDLQEPSSACPQTICQAAGRRSKPAGASPVVTSRQ
jgi:hypothetical protein